ncbi:MAG: septum site-determining protein Ssd, partial [Sciscionella sp.]
LREAPAERVGRIVSVIGARGGAGASVFAGALGVAAAGSGRRSLLVDCDPLGSGLDVLFGLEDVGGLRWPDLTLTTGRIAASALHEALVSAPGPRGELTLLSGARSGSGPTETALHPVLDTSKRAGDLVVCDLPRSVTGPAAVAIGQSDLVVVLVPAEVRACGCARRLTAELAQLGASIAVVVRGPAPGGLRASDIAAALDLPPVAVMRPEPGLDRRLEQGRFGTTFRGPLIAAARQVLAHVDAPLELGVR